MPRRKTVTAKVIHAARRNIKRAQMSRIRIREPRSVGRITASRMRYSRPATGRRARMPLRRTR